MGDSDPHKIIQGSWREAGLEPGFQIPFCALDSQRNDREETCLYRIAKTAFTQASKLLYPKQPSRTTNITTSKLDSTCHVCRPLTSTWKYEEGPP